MPIVFLQPGETRPIRRLSGPPALRRRLQDLGLEEDAVRANLGHRGALASAMNSAWAARTRSASRSALGIALRHATMPK